MLIKTILRILWMLFPILAAWLLLGCTPSQTIEVTSAVIPMETEIVQATLLPTPTQVPEMTPTAVSPTPSPLPQPSPSPTPEIEAERPFPTATLPPFPLISRNLTMQFTIENQFGGVPQAIHVAEHKAYVGFGPRLYIVDVSDPQNIRLLGQSEVLQDAIKGIAVRDDLAFVGAGSSGLQIWDVSNPAAIAPISQLTDSMHDAGKVTLMGNNAFVQNPDRSGAGNTLLVRVDISDPAQPTQLDSLTVTQSDQVAFAENLVLRVGNGRLQLHDANNLSTIISETPLAGGDYSSNLFVQYPLVFVAQSGQMNGMEVFDVSDPAQVTAVSDFIPGPFFFMNHTAGNANTIFIAGTFGEFGYCSTQIFALDITNPAQPENRHEFDPENCVTDMTLVENRLYVVGKSGLKIYDVADPTNPILLAHFTHPHGFHDAQGIAIQDNFAYILSIEGRQADLRTIDLQQPSTPIGTPVAFDSTTILDLYQQDNLLLAPLWNGGVNVLDITQPDSPQLITTASQDGTMNSELFSFAAADKMIYTPYFAEGMMGGIVAMDMSNPAALVKTAVIETGDHGIYGLEVHGNYLYALSQESETTINIFDISDRSSPTHVNRLTMPTGSNKMALIDNTLYVACDSNCNMLTILDISDPANPAISTSFALFIDVWDMVVDTTNQLVYLITYDDGIWAMDIRDRNAPVITDHFPLPRGTVRLLPDNGSLWIAANGMGLYQLQIGK